MMTMKSLYLICGVALGFVLAASASMAETNTGEAAPSIIHPRVEQSLISELRLVYPASDISLVGGIRWDKGSLPEQIEQIRLTQDHGNGDVRFLIRGSAEAEGTISFQAFKRAWIPVRRIAPGTALKREYFRLERINVAAGMERELRGLILPENAEIDSLETRQTLLEGQFVQLTQVQRVHDVKRGEPVQVRMKAGDVTLSTLGTAEEPAYLDQPVRVLIQKTKRSLAGKLTERGWVEVNL